ncbi:hypothetical protein EU522_01670 [Candidatus Thorarchaeota archaeon]|nr:MAG: hypothetical protein EU522_01670 [Candidatus Thorarchaeota archaeon]
MRLSLIEGFNVENDGYYQSEGEATLEIGRDPRGFFLAGLAGSLIGLFATTIGTVIILGPRPLSEFNIMTLSVIGLVGTVGYFLFVLGIYGLSIEYNATILSLVAIVEMGLFILAESVNRFLSPILDVNTLTALSFVLFAADLITSVVFGIALLRLRERVPQPVVFLGYGLIEVFWPLVYFLLASFAADVLYLFSPTTSLILDILGTILFLNEYRRYPVVVDGSDWVHHSQAWE